MSCLGAVFLERESLPKLNAILKTSDFYRETHRHIFKVMVDLYANGISIDALTVSEKLRMQGLLEQIGGLDYLGTLVEGCVTSLHLKDHADIVKAMSVKREVAVMATDLAAMAYNGVSADALVGEMQRRAASLDRVTSAPIVIQWEGFNAAIQANEEYLQREPVVDKLLYRRASSMIVGGKHHGKSTLTRWLATCVYHGWNFIGRDVRQGPVFYIASEDEEMAARSELMRLGWKEDNDQLLFLPASKIGDDRTGFLDWVIKESLRVKPALIVIDMLFDFLNIKDEMSYAETRRAVGTIQRVASAGDTHVVGTHHSPKHSASDDAAIAALGSQGLAAKVSPIILVRKFGPGVHSISSTSVRDPRGEAILNSRLIRNEDGSMELGGAFKTYMLAEVYMVRVAELLESEPGAEMTVGDVVEGLTIPYEVARACLSSMVKLGTVARTGLGKKGKPYRYSIPIVELDKLNGNPIPNSPHTPLPVGDSGIAEGSSAGKSSNKQNLSEARLGIPRADRTDTDDDLDQYGISKGD